MAPTRNLAEDVLAEFEELKVQLAAPVKAELQKYIAVADTPKRKGTRKQNDPSFSKEER